MKKEDTYLNLELRAYFATAKTAISHAAGQIKLFSLSYQENFAFLPIFLILPFYYDPKLTKRCAKYLQLITISLDGK